VNRDPVRKARLEAANRLLATLPTPARLYETIGGLHLFMDRMGSGFPNVDIVALVNPDSGFFMCPGRPHKRPNLPWGSTIELMTAELVTWVREAGTWRAGYWDEMVKAHGHWLKAEAVAEYERFLAGSWKAPGTGGCMADWAPGEEAAWLALTPEQQRALARQNLKQLFEYPQGLGKTL
jgi:hypothetical protein